MLNAEATVNPQAQGAGAKIIVGAAGVNRYLCAADGYYCVTPDAVMHACRGTVATVPVVDTEYYMIANNTQRMGPMLAGQYLCFFSTPGGNVWITPQA
jgi:hypothetical protein